VKLPEHDQLEKLPDPISVAEIHAMGSGNSSALTESGPVADKSDRSSARCRAGLIALLSGWDSLRTPIPEVAIRNGLEGLRLNRESLLDYINFN
jgi:hypothetical protein